MCTAAHAQIKTFDDVVIVGRRTLKESAVTKTVIDSVKMAESVNASFAELLSKHSSIFVKTYGQGSTATV